MAENSFFRRRGPRQSNSLRERWHAKWDRIRRFRSEQEISVVGSLCSTLRIPGLRRRRHILTDFEDGEWEDVPTRDGAWADVSYPTNVLLDAPDQRRSKRYDPNIKPFQGIEQHARGSRQEDGVGWRNTGSPSDWPRSSEQLRDRHKSPSTTLHRLSSEGSGKSFTVATGICTPTPRSTPTWGNESDKSDSRRSVCSCCSDPCTPPRSSRWSAGEDSFAGKNLRTSITDPHARAESAIHSRVSRQKSFVTFKGPDSLISYRVSSDRPSLMSSYDESPRGYKSRFDIPNPRNSRSSSRSSRRGTSMSPITVIRGTDDGEAQVFRLTQTVLQTGHSRGRLMSFYDNDQDDWWSNQGGDDASSVGDPSSRGLSPSPSSRGDVDEPEHEEALMRSSNRCSKKK